jgi:hypothetical protein
VTSWTGAVGHPAPNPFVTGMEMRNNPFSTSGLGSPALNPFSRGTGMQDVSSGTTTVGNPAPNPFITSMEMHNMPLRTSGSGNSASHIPIPVAKGFGASSGTSPFGNPAPNPFVAGLEKGDIASTTSNVGSPMLKPFIHGMGTLKKTYGTHVSMRSLTAYPYQPPPVPILGRGFGLATRNNDEDTVAIKVEPIDRPFIDERTDLATEELLQVMEGTWMDSSLPTDVRLNLVLREMNQAKLVYGEDSEAYRMLSATYKQLVHTAQRSRFKKSGGNPSASSNPPLLKPRSPIMSKIPKVPNVPKAPKAPKASLLPPKASGDVAKQVLARRFKKAKVSAADDFIQAI